MTPQPWDFGRGLAGYAWRSPGTRAAVLLTHGYAEYAERYVAHYNHLIPNLVTAGLDVYAFDMSGHGNSPGARGVADVIGAVEDHRAARHVIATEGKPLFLFGHSLGGLVTAASVVAEPEACAGVVLSAPALLIEALAPGWRTRLRRSPLHSAFFPSFPPTKSRAYRKKWPRTTVIQ